MTDAGLRLRLEAVDGLILRLSGGSVYQAGLIAGLEDLRRRLLAAIGEENER